MHYGNLGITDFKFPEPTKTNSRLIDFVESDVENFVYPNPEKMKNIKMKENKQKQHSLDINLKNEFVSSIRLGSLNKGGQGERIYSPYGTSINYLHMVVVWEKNRIISN